MINALNENTEAQERVIDPTLRLSRDITGLAQIESDNISEVRYLRATLLQQTNVANKLKESVLKADKINVKGLGTSVTLQKIISKNSNAIENSNVGYLRAAEMFIDNFSEGIRKTEGGTLRLTEQLIRTEQDTAAFRDVNRTLLGATGRNYDALSDLNDSVLDSADSYQISTQKLLEGIQRLQGELNEFAMFGPDVAANLSTEFGKVTARMQGLGQGQVEAFIGLFKGGLEGRALREQMGLQQFGESMARGAVNAQEIEAAMLKAGDFVEGIVQGQSMDVAVELLKARGVRDENTASQLVQLNRLVKAGPDIQKDLLATQKEQTDTVKMQTEKANKYYDEIAPAALKATTALLAPALMTAQGVNALAMMSGGYKSAMTLAGVPAGGKRGPAGPKIGPVGNFTMTPQQLPGANVRIPPNYVPSNLPQQTGLKATLKGFSNDIKGVFSQPKRLMGSPMGVGALALGGQFLAGDRGNAATQAIGGAADFAGMASMAQMLVPKLKMAMPTGMIAAAGAAAMDGVDSLLGFEKGGVGDSVTDVLKTTGEFASYGAFLGPMGALAGGAIGATYGTLREIFDWDGEREALDAQKEQVRLLKEEKEARLAAQRKANVEKSDFILMSIVDNVRNQQAAARITSEEKLTASNEILGRIEKLLDKSNQVAIDASTRKSGDMNK